MVSSSAKTVRAYLDALPADRRAEVEAVRKVILKNLDPAFEEGMQYGMIGYYVPHKVFPAGYHVNPKEPLPFAAIAAQKNNLSVYLMSVYGDPDEEKKFRESWAKSGKKLDMGKSCVRFKKVADIPLEVIGAAIKRVSAKKFIARYEATLGARATGAQKSKTRAKPAK